jgi:AAHS family 4-hydroxybenzoate transporter-like MFS transporter
MNRVVRLGLDSQFDSGRLGRAQIGIVVMCALVVLIDGFDTHSIALVAPDIATAWGVAPASIGLVSGIGLFGGLLGAVAFGWVSDRFGRKPSVLIAVTLFGIASLLTPLAGSVSALAAGRLLTGFGLGGALPAVIAITSEYTPARMRATVVGVMFCGFPLGAMLGGLASVRLVPAFGWQSVFVVGGVVPLLLLPLLVFRLPESARFLALNGEEERLARVLARVGLDAPPEAEEAESDGGRSRVGRLFSGGRAVGTLSLWATLFLSLLLTYLLASWIPLLARQAGLGPASATLGVVALNLGAIVGCVVIGRIADRTRPPVVVGIAFALGAVAIAAIGRSQHSGAVLLVASLLAGGLSIGAQMCAVGLCAGFSLLATRRWTSRDAKSAIDEDRSSCSRAENHAGVSSWSGCPAKVVNCSPVNWCVRAALTARTARSFAGSS